MAVKAINNSAGLDRIVSTLLVFGAYPQMTKMDTSSPSIIKRAEVICIANKEICCL